MKSVWLGLGVIAVTLSLTFSESVVADGTLFWESFKQQSQPDDLSAAKSSDAELGESYGPFTALDKCTPYNCRPYKCRCAGSDVPGQINVSEVPQMVLFSTQYAMNAQYYTLWNQLFSGHKNPNGCPKTGTFFVSHNNTDYFTVQSLYAARHEIGDHTVDANNPPYTDPLNTWRRELGYQKLLLAKWAQIPYYDIHGMRAPALTPDGDAMLDALEDVGLRYSSTRTTTQHIHSPDLLWPWTYDFASSQECTFGACPKNPHRGVWEVPLVTWPDSEGHAWAAPAALRGIDTEEKAYQLLKNKFLEHYKSSNRAPLPIVLDAMWMVTDYKFKATLRFMDFLDLFKDVYVVSNWQALQWTMQPTAMSGVGSFRPFTCKDSLPPVCRDPITCHFDSHNKLIPSGQPGTPVHSLHTCVKACPPCWPRLGDYLGLRC